MTFYISNANGDSADQPSAEVMRRFLAELDPDDEEHGAAWVGDEDGNVLEYEIDGNLAFDRGGRARHLSDVPHERVVELWLKLAAGQLDEIEREPWQPGARRPLSPEERAARDRELAEWQLTQDRAFYDSLGAESPSPPCREKGCGRGAMVTNVFCRRHHFENVKKRPCPFND